MVDAFLDINIVTAPFAVCVYSAAGLAIAALILVRPSRRWRRSRWFLTALIAAAVGTAAGYTLVWLVDDVWHSLDVGLSAVVHTWIAVGFAGMAVALASLWWATWRRIIAALLAIVLFAGTTAMTVNIDIGQYPTARSALGISVYSGRTLPSIAKPDPSTQTTIADWTPPAGLPATGAVGLVTIPGTVSHFAARQAVVYLPPAALAPNPPDLPVMVMLSGQPGSPDAPLSTAGLLKTLDAYAAAHDGLAPIVVSPDQLGSQGANPMCVDSPLGNSATYLTVDVPNWIRANLNVLPSPHYWAIGGLSQGGTCSIQLGAGHPELFSGIVDASGQLAPTLGNDTKTIDRAFGGNAAAYDAAKPLAIMAAKAPYTDTVAVFGVGANDHNFMPGVKKIVAAAEAAGMTTDYLEVPDSGHDARAWGGAFAEGVTVLGQRWGFDR
jgi:enterochelin esterase-like enzyme